MKVNLIQGDCIEEMRCIEGGSVDMILTDPPYGMAFQSNYRKDKHKKIAGDDSLGWLDCFSSECWRVAAPDTAHYFFTSFHNIDLFKQAIENHFTIKNILVWEKSNTSMGDLTGDFAPKVEFIILAHKGRRLMEGSRDPNIFRFDKTKNELHPTQKPVDLCEYLISKFSSAGDLVFDPFMGSGTTGVAAKKTGRRFSGIELDADYFRTAKERIDMTNQQFELGL